MRKKITIIIINRLRARNTTFVHRADAASPRVFFFIFPRSEHGRARRWRVYGGRRFGCNRSPPPPIHVLMTILRKTFLLDKNQFVCSCNNVFITEICSVGHTVTSLYRFKLSNLKKKNCKFIEKPTEKLMVFYVCHPPPPTARNF